MDEETGLNNMLRLNDIEEVYLVGLPYEYSVAATAEDAIANNFKTYIIADGCKPISRNSQVEMDIRLVKKGVRTIRSRTLLES